MCIDKSQKFDYCAFNYYFAKDKRATPLILKTNCKQRCTFTSGIDMQFSRILNTALFVFMALYAGSIDAKPQKDSVKYTVLHNISSDECQYAGEVVIDVRYKYFSNDVGHITIEQSTDGFSFFLVLSQDIERGRGSTIIGFNAGECVKELKISLQ